MVIYSINALDYSPERFEIWLPGRIAQTMIFPFNTSYNTVRRHSSSYHLSRETLECDPSMPAVGAVDTTVAQLLSWQVNSLQYRALQTPKIRCDCYQLHSTLGGHYL